MSNSIILVFKISFAFGQLAWKQSVINCLMQNKACKLELSGSHAAAVGNALKIPFPKITVEATQITNIAVIVVTLATLVYVQPLLDVLNTATNRGYTAKVRWKRKGAGVQDDVFILELVP